MTLEDAGGNTALKSLAPPADDTIAWLKTIIEPGTCHPGGGDVARGHGLLRALRVERAAAQ